MKKFFTFLTFFILLVSTAVAQDVDFWDGKIIPFNLSGNAGESVSNPILIESGAHLAYLAQQVNAIIGNNSYEKKYFKLTKNIDLDGQNWTPIGWHLTNAYNRHFKGNFDGNGYTIANLTISSPYLVRNAANTADVNCSTYALFGAIEGGGRGVENGGVVLKNLGITSGTITATGSVSAFVAWAAGVAITQCYNKANVEGTNYVGAMAAYPVNPSVDVINCYNMGTMKITANATANKAVGGLIGSTSTAWITNSYNFGDIIVNGSIPANAWGGLTGKFQSTRQPINSYYVTNCVANGNAFGTSISEANMLVPSFVLDINNDQDPVKWVVDASKINFGLPILAWEVDRGSLDVNKMEQEAVLSTIYPNPFSVNSQITVALSSSMFVSVKIYNLLGQEVKVLFNGIMEAGTETFTLNSTDFTPGVYTCQLITLTQRLTQRMIVE